MPPSLVLRIAILSSIFPFVSASPVELVRLSHVCRCFRECLQDYGAETWEVCVLELARKVFGVIERQVYHRQQQSQSSSSSSVSTANTAAFGSLSTLPTQPRPFAKPWVRLFESECVLWVLHSILRHLPVKVPSSSPASFCSSEITAHDVFTFELFGVTEAIERVFLNSPALIAAGAGNLETVKFVYEALHVVSNRRRNTTAQDSEDNNNLFGSTVDGPIGILNAAIKSTCIPSEERRVEVVRWLVDQKLVNSDELKQFRPIEQTPLVLAAERGQLEVCCEILAVCPNMRASPQLLSIALSGCSPSSSSPSSSASRSRHRRAQTQHLQLLQQQFREQSEGEKQRRTTICQVLLEAVGDDHPAARRLLAGDPADMLGPPLIAAARQANLSAVRLLLKQRYVNGTMQDPLGARTSALHAVCSRRVWTSSAGPQQEQQGAAAAAAAHTPSIESQICQLLLDAGIVSVFSRGGSGNTALHLAAVYEAPADVLETLLQADDGADGGGGGVELMKMRNNEGKTASQVAQKGPLKFLYDWIAKQSTATET